jgi:hypothetical protein
MRWQVANGAPKCHSSDPAKTGLFRRDFMKTPRRNPTSRI